MDYSIGCFVGRIWNKTKNGPCLITIRDEYIYDITSKEIPTMRDLLELDNIKEYVSKYTGEKVISVKELLLSSMKNQQDRHYSLLAPCDFQAIKACGVTFAKSMV